ncbi:MAG: DUF6882 domain-containing protein [Solimonas sp.]
MTEEQFHAYLDLVTEALRVKQDALVRQHGFGTFHRWWFEQERAALQFFDKDDRLLLEADVVSIGSFAPSTKTFKWAWANASVLPALRDKARAVRELEAHTGLELFRLEEAFEVDGEGMAWELTAMAVHQLGALGAYRAPSPRGGATAFFAIMGVRPAPAVA